VFPGAQVHAQGGEGLDQCDYLLSSPLVRNEPPQSFAVTAIVGPLSNKYVAYTGYSVPSWASPSTIRRVSRAGATGSEAVRCENQLNWCQGWLRTSEGQAKWVVTASGNRASLRRVEAFLHSFEPVVSDGDQHA
jgi:hypothetical protein